MSDNGLLKRDSGIVIKEGFLVKQGHVRHNWKTRWFKLSDISLRYYKSKNETVPHGRIPLRDAKLSLYHSENKGDKDREFVMEVETREGVIYPIQAPSNEELKAWMECIHGAIEHLKLESDVHLMSSHFRSKISSGELSTAEVLGSYVDAYGRIKKETRTVNGVKRSDGFSGIALRVWMEHTTGLGGSEAAISVSGLQNVGVLDLIDGGTTEDLFSHSKYYILHSDEDALKKMVGATNSTPGSTKSTSSIADSVFLPPEILNASEAPVAVLPTDLPLGEIVKRGVLIKRGHVVASWKARCFVLQRFPATLSYFDPSKKNPKVLNSLSLHGATVFAVSKIAAQEGLRMRYPPDHLFCVKVSDGTLYIIMASSDVEREEWIEAIQPMCRKMKNAAVPSSGAHDSKT